MKKAILAAAVSTLFMMGAVHADTNANDVSASLSVTGSVTNDYACAVTLSNSTVALDSDITTLGVQGVNNPPNMKNVEITLSGDSQCSDLIAQQKVAYKFVGTVDSADGNVLANTVESDAGAKGVGVGLYDKDGKTIAVNHGTLLANLESTQLGLSLVKLNGQDVSAGGVQSSVTIEIERL
ncbi:fimbrial protein [Cronobacter dublinensis]|uniref:fimbrial protein n=1 Tax=Cronobacter dublinensis TaxID=413497 RepID=UPI000CFAB7A3|nr:fimbrial protein [Cronobacter dublinensis]